MQTFLAYNVKDTTAETEYKDTTAHTFISTKEPTTPLQALSTNARNARKCTHAFEVMIYLLFHPVLKKLTLFCTAAMQLPPLFSMLMHL